jgi:hypothetical protein
MTATWSKLEKLYLINRADDGGRTRDLNLGKVPRYQLRYVRIRSAEALREGEIYRT